MTIEINKLKILIPVCEFGKSGGYRVLSELANYWISKGNEVVFLCFYVSDLPYYPTKADIVWVSNKGKIVNNIITARTKGDFKKMICGLFNYINKHSGEYDIILANHNITSIPIYFASKTNNYYYIQAYEPEFPLRTIFKLIAWLTYFLPLKRIVNADIYTKYKNIRSNIVIPPGLDLNIFYPKILEPDNKETLIVGCIGRIEEWKGSNDVGEAVKILHEKGYKVILKSAFNSVKYKCHELVYPDGDENLADFYRSLDVLVAPGHIQLGAVHYPVIEAMACNVPVITTGYYPANEQNSFIVPIKSPEKIAEIIELIMKDYSIVISKAELAKKMIEEFDWEIVSNKFIKVFKETVAHENIS